MKSCGHIKPNILLIVADQHRYDCLGCSGSRYPVKTPNLDRLAGEGTFFERAFTPFPVCAPARQAMLTGRMPDSQGTLFNYDFISGIPLRPDEGYWPAKLADVGYRTAFVGKWHISKGYGAADFGYKDVYNLAEYNAYISEKYPEVEYVNGWFGETSPIPYEEAQPHYLACKVCSHIETYSENNQPWHIRLDLTVPHLPCRPSKPFSDMYGPQDAVPWEGFGDTFINKPYIQKQQLLNWGIEGKPWREWAQTAARYYAVISQIDDAVGMMLDALDNTGQAENTVVIYTSDHGDMCGSHGMMDKHYVLYDDVIRVPLIVKWPGMAKGVRSCEFVSNCLDLPATIADMAGLELDRGHGASLVPLLTGCKESSSNSISGQTAARPGYIVASANGQQFGLYTQRCIRTGKWKYIWNLTDRDELYDLDKDHGEINNLADEEGYSQPLTALRKLLYEELLRLEDPFVKAGWLKRQLIEGKKL